MIIKTLSILMIFFIGNTANLQNDIVGVWENDKMGYTIKIFKQDNQYFGKIIVVASDKSDDEVGHILLRNLVFDENNKLYSGEVKMRNGMSLNCKITLIHRDRFQLTVKKLFIKKTKMFKRIE